MLQHHGNVPLLPLGRGPTLTTNWLKPENYISQLCLAAKIKYLFVPVQNTNIHNTIQQCFDIRKAVIIN